MILSLLPGGDSLALFQRKKGHRITTSKKKLNFCNLSGNAFSLEVNEDVPIRQVKESIYSQALVEGAYPFQMKILGQEVEVCDDMGVNQLPGNDFTLTIMPKTPHGAFDEFTRVLNAHADEVGGWRVNWDNIPRLKFVMEKGLVEAVFDIVWDAFVHLLPSDGRYGFIDYADHPWDFRLLCFGNEKIRDHRVWVKSEKTHFFFYVDEQDDLNKNWMKVEIMRSKYDADATRHFNIEYNAERSRYEFHYDKFKRSASLTP